MRNHPIALSLVAPFILIGSLPAAAQRTLTDAELRTLATSPAIAAAIAACRTDRQRFCATVAPGGGRIAACLAARTETLSPGCQAAMTKARAAVEVQQFLPPRPAQ